jgi:alpha-galactosidase
MKTKFESSQNAIAMPLSPACAYRTILILTAMVFARAVYPQRTLIRIGTSHDLLLLGVDRDSTLKQLYYGKQLAETDASSAAAQPTADALFTGGSPAYPSYGDNGENAAVALRVTHSDGNLTTRLRYLGYTVTRPDDNTILTAIRLRDSDYPFDITLFYKAYTKEDVIEEWQEISHREKGNVVLFDIASAGLAVHSPDCYLTYYYGNFANEFNMLEEQLQPGEKIIDSKLGVRVDQYSSPSFLLSVGGRLQENDGEVIGGTLAWPGNWQLRFDVDDQRQLSVFSGINPYGSQYALPPGTPFRTPSFLYTYSAAGAGEVTRHFHRWARKYGIRDGYGERDVLLNNWEATYFNFDEQKLAAIIQSAGSMGFEQFLLDDGWFGNKYPRNNDDAGLGDWQVNTRKLPHGIPFLIRTCRENHLKFGIWIEPEMVNPKSELYEQHPDWIISAANRRLDLQRNQLILDLSNPQVVEYVYGVIAGLLTENKDISYLKWDCNRYITNPGSAYLGKDRQTELFIDYPRAILQIMDRVRQHFPAVTMMVCSGGGGRMDYGTLPYFQEYWPSDNTDAADRVRIQWGLEYFFPAVGLASHVSAIPNGMTGRTEPLKFRFDVAMAGRLGMDLQPMQMTGEEKTFSRNAIATYKSIRDVVLHGDLYRLASPYAGARAAQMYVSEDSSRAIVFSYLLSKNIYGDKSILRLKGLQRDARYTLRELNKGGFSRLGEFEGHSLTGAFLMDHGLEFPMYNEYESAVFGLDRQ